LTRRKDRHDEEDDKGQRKRIGEKGRGRGGEKVQAEKNLLRFA